MKLVPKLGDLVRLIVNRQDDTLMLVLRVFDRPVYDEPGRFVIRCMKADGGTRLCWSDRCRVIR